MYYTHCGYQTSIFGKNSAYVIGIFFGKQYCRTILLFIIYYYSLISVMNCVVYVLWSTIRLEFNQSHLDYYTELDAVCLEGSRCRSQDLQRLPNSHVSSAAGDGHVKLPHSDSHSHYYVQTGASVSARECLSPMDILSRGLARLHVQNGLTAALDISDNGYFDLLPVCDTEIVVLVYI